MTAALFGLAGVIVGGLLSGAIQLALERRREKRSIAIAKRLVIDEVHNVWTHLDLLVKNGVTPQALDDDVKQRFLPVRNACRSA